MVFILFCVMFVVCVVVLCVLCVMYVLCVLFVCVLFEKMFDFIV